MFNFLLFGRGRGPRPNSKKNTKTRPRPNSKTKKKTDAPLPSVLLFLAVWAGGRVMFLAVWAGGVCVFFLLFGRGWWGGGACVLFLLFGQGGGGGNVFFFAAWAGCVLFRLPVCLACLQATQQQKRPNNKKNTGSVLEAYGHYFTYFWGLGKEEGNACMGIVWDSRSLPYCPHKPVQGLGSRA